MSIASVGSKWISGALAFIKKSDNSEILTINPSGVVDVHSQFIKGKRSPYGLHNFAAADVAKTFFIAPAACKIISAYETHATVAGQAGTLQVEKLTTGQAPGNGAVTLASAFDLTSTANTPVSINALTTSAATMAAGDVLCLKLASGAATSYALGTITIIIEWL
jgi:hypothetical protein